MRGSTMDVLRRCLLMAATLDIDLSPVWIPSNENSLADALSRYQMSRITDLCPQLNTLTLPRSHAPTTRRNYASARQRYLDFCTMNNFKHGLPRIGSGRQMKAIASAGAGPTIKVKTLKSYLGGLKSWHIDLGADISGFGDSRLERLLDGIKREHSEPFRRDRTPLTRQYLLRILRVLNTGVDDYSTATLRAAITLAFAAFLRSGEITYTAQNLELGSAFRNYHVTKSSIRIAADESYLELSLPASKGDPFRQSVQILVAATGDEACPVRAMVQLLEKDSTRSALAPLFTSDMNKPFTRDYLVKSLRTLAVRAGLEQLAWHGHSFRR
ncbi:uncharacterized protein H6S33_008256 [Morchella sextelata]|uniref:uncharacterized protein n=1 Tax=Morchella sextelata TaxID=1174677 RepID=UPI001D046E93|nr:uncharacterized protein H6S33_008256 [Morchella sextelata]KAH0603252.1 hypothetical protein H6S33_008256 [Morchella sextelata]